MNKSEIKAIVEGSPSSIFTRTDVLALIDKLDERSKVAASESVDVSIRELFEAIDDVDRIDTSDCEVELELEGMEIIVSNVHVNGLDDALSELRSAAENLRELVRQAV